MAISQVRAKPPVVAPTPVAFVPVEDLIAEVQAPFAPSRAPAAAEPAPQPAPPTVAIQVHFDDCPGCGMG